MKKMAQPLHLLALVTAILLICSNSSSATTPADIYNPSLWYKPSYFDGIVTPGEYISVPWLDEISQVPATPFGPFNSFQTNVVNGQPVVGMDHPSGDGQWWVQDVDMPANLLSGTNDYTIIAVVRSDDPVVDVNNVGIAATWGPTANGQGQWYLSAESDQFGGGGYQRTTATGNGSTFRKLADFGLSTAQITSDFNIYGFVKSGGSAGNFSYHTNGITLAAMSGTGGQNSDLGANDQGGFGRRLVFGNSGGHFKGDLAEIIFWNYALNEQQLAGVDTYLRGKFVVPEPATGVLVFIGIGALVLARQRAVRAEQCSA